MVDRTKTYEVIFWLSLTVILLWAILKAVGIINSPLWVDMIPLAGGIFAAGSFFQMVLGMKKDISNINLRQNKMATGLTKLELQFSHLEKRFDNNIS